MRFQRRADGFDYFINHCLDCGVAYQEEKWLIRERDGTVFRMELVERSTKYRRILDENQPDYLLPPGSGHVSVHDFREARVADAFVGHSVRRLGKRSQGGTG